MSYGADCRCTFAVLCGKRHKQFSQLSPYPQIEKAPAGECRGFAPKGAQTRRVGSAALSKRIVKMATTHAPRIQSHSRPGAATGGHEVLQFDTLKVIYRVINRGRTPVITRPIIRAELRLYAGASANQIQISNNSQSRQDVGPHNSREISRVRRSNLVEMLLLIWYAQLGDYLGR